MNFLALSWMTKVLNDSIQPKFVPFELYELQDETVFLSEWSLCIHIVCVSVLGPSKQP